VSGKQIRVGSGYMAEHRAEAGMGNINQAIFLDGDRTFSF
jgi:hypothetical protein